MTSLFDIFSAAMTARARIYGCQMTPVYTAVYTGSVYWAEVFSHSDTWQQSLRSPASSMYNL